MILFLKWCLLLFWIVTVSFCNPSVDDEVKENTDDEQSIHIHLPDLMIKENNISATCTEDGSYDNVIYCVYCDFEFFRNTIIQESAGHSNADVVKENEIQTTCTDNGSHYAVVYCLVCEVELSRELITVESPGHTPSDPIIEDEIPPVCKTDGSCTAIINCTVCSTELSRETETIPAIGHEWIDDVCKNCSIPFSVEESLEFALSEDGTYYIITGIGTFYKTELIMPSEYKGLPVKEIGNDAFRDCTFVTKAVIPASVTRLGYGAAYGCTSLEKLIFEDPEDWYLMRGEDATEGTKIPTLILKNPSIYIDQLIISNILWMQKSSS